MIHSLDLSVTPIGETGCKQRPELHVKTREDFCLQMLSGQDKAGNVPGDGIFGPG